MTSKKLPPLETYETLLEEARQVRGVSLGQDAWRQLRKNRAAMLALLYLIVLALLAFFTPLLPLASPREQNLQNQYQPPRLLHPGTGRWWASLFSSNEAPPAEDQDSETPASEGVDSDEPLRRTVADVPAGVEGLAQLAWPLNSEETSQERAQRDQAYQDRFEELYGNKIWLHDRFFIWLRLMTFGGWTLPPWAGTDSLGIDLLSQLFWGARVSLLVGLVATLVSLVIGVTFGSVAGFLGGWVDELMMRIVDILYSVPFIFVVIFLVTILNAEENKSWMAARGIDQLVVFFVVIGAIYWLTMARVVRGQIISLKEEQFVEAARTVGASQARIIFRHMIPNILSVVIVYLTLTIPAVMLFEAFLSFLGLGVQVPDVSWGLLAANGLKVITPIRIYWWLVAFPGFLLALTLFALNFLGDGLRDALDPRLKNR